MVSFVCWMGEISGQTLRGSNMRNGLRMAVTLRKERNKATLTPSITKLSRTETPSREAPSASCPWGPSQRQAEPPDRNPTRLKPFLTKHKENYLTLWKQPTKNQSRLERCLALNRERVFSGRLPECRDRSATMYRLSEGSERLPQADLPPQRIKAAHPLCTAGGRNCTKTSEKYYPQITTTKRLWKHAW